MVQICIIDNPIEVDIKLALSLKVQFSNDKDYIMYNFYPLTKTSMDSSQFRNLSQIIATVHIRYTSTSITIKNQDELTYLFFVRIVYDLKVNLYA